MASQVLQRLIFKPRGKIFKEGDDDNMAYLIREGEVENVEKIDGVVQVLDSVRQRGIFGETAHIGSGPSMASAHATNSAMIVCITQQMFGLKLRKAGPCIQGLPNTLADSIRSMRK